ncbi:hypothetical protein V6N13_108498 [Hibiscus sabdariffa]
MGVGHEVAFDERVPKLRLWVEVSAVNSAWISTIIPYGARYTQLILDDIIVFVFKCPDQAVNALLIVGQIEEVVDGCCVGRDKMISNINHGVFPSSVVGIEFSNHIDVCLGRLSAKPQPTQICQSFMNHHLKVVVFQSIIVHESLLLPNILGSNNIMVTFSSYVIVKSGRE